MLDRHQTAFMTLAAPLWKPGRSSEAHQFVMFERVRTNPVGWTGNANANDDDDGSVI